MVSNVVAAACQDALTVCSSKTFFTQEKTQRSAAVVDALGTAYPQALRAYLSTASAETVASDLRQLIPLLTQEGVVLAQVEQLRSGEGNTFFNALVNALRQEVRQWLETAPSGDSRLAAMIAHAHAAGTLYVNILIREMQELYAAATGEDSPQVQLAGAVDDQTRAAFLQRDLPGIPSVKVNRELLGGARQFYNGVLQDDSWRARLTRVLRIVS